MISLDGQPAARIYEWHPRPLKFTQTICRFMGYVGQHGLGCSFCTLRSIRFVALRGIIVQEYQLKPDTINIKYTQSFESPNVARG